MMLRARGLQLRGRWGCRGNFSARAQVLHWSCQRPVVIVTVLDAVVSKSNGEGQTDNKVNKVISTPGGVDEEK